DSLKFGMAISIFSNRPRHLRQIRGAHEVAVALARRLSALADGPDDQALAAAHVAGGEDALHARGVLALFRLGVGARVAIDVQLAQDRVLGAQETHGKKDQIGLPNFFRARNLAERGTTVVAGDPFDVDGMKLLHVSRGIADEFFRKYRVDAWIGA